MVGEDINTHQGPTRSGPPREGMESSYAAARRRAHHSAGDYDDPNPPVVPFESIALKWHQQDQAPGAAYYFQEWLVDESKAAFDLQRFTRKALVKWLRVTRFPSAYQFDLAAPAELAVPVEKPIESRERNALLNIIGGLLGLMLGHTPAGKPQSTYVSQSAIILALDAHFAGHHGISKSNLETKFAEAKRSIKSQ